jgi:predicted SpoU family rRNA methylase
MSNRLGEFFRGIKTSAEKIKASVEKAGRLVQGLDPDESLHYGGYTLTVGQKFGMRRLIDGTGQQYISEGKIVGFRKNDVVIERYSLSEGRYIFEAYSIEKFVRKINRGEITGIPKDPNLVVKSYGGYTFEVGQTFKMWREIIPTGETYLSSGEIVGFQKNGTIVITKRYSFSNGRYIFKEYPIEEFVRMIESGQIIEIPKDPNPAEPIDEERVAREEDQRRINEIRRSIRDSIGAEAGVETPPTETSKIYDKTKGIEVYTTLDGEAIACYTSKYRRPNQEDRAVVGSKEIGGRVVNLMCAIDGVGGESHGEFAAQAFAESIQEIFNGLEDLSAPSDQNSLSEWQIIQDSLIIPAMNKARKKIEAKALEAKKAGGF